MRKWIAFAVAGTLTITSAGCYHATVETGRAPSGQTIEQPWASGFVFGLVPPSTVNTAAECPAGVARVETQLSFLNQLVSVVTLGIYTPMTIRVECAAPGAAMLEDTPAPVVTLPTGSSREDFGRALDWAAKHSVDLGHPVYVEFSALE